MFSQFGLFNSGNSSTISSRISKKSFNWLPGPSLVMRFGSRLARGTSMLVYNSPILCGWKMLLSLLSLSTSFIRMRQLFHVWKESSWNRIPLTFFIEALLHWHVFLLSAVVGYITKLLRLTSLETSPHSLFFFPFLFFPGVSGKREFTCLCQHMFCTMICSWTISSRSLYTAQYTKHPNLNEVRKEVRKSEKAITWYWFHSTANSHEFFFKALIF